MEKHFCFQSNLTLHMHTGRRMPCFVYSTYEWNYNSGILHWKSVSIHVTKENVSLKAHVQAAFSWQLFILGTIHS